MNKVNQFFKNSRELLLRPQTNIFSAAFVIAIAYGVSMLLGILRERVLVSRFYACCSQDLDVYYAAFRMPDMIFQLVVTGALSAAFIPVFSEYLARSEEEAYKMAVSLIKLLMVIFISVSVVIFIFAKPFSGRITGNFQESQINLMAQMTRVMLLAQVFFLVSNFFSATLQTKQRFLLPSLSPVVYNLGIILSVYFFSPVLGIWSATIGVLIGAFFHLSIQYPLVKKLGFKLSAKADFKNPGVKKVLRLMLPRTLSLATSQIEATISLFLATSLSAGSLTLYYLTQRLVDLPVRLIGTSVGQAALPLLSLQLAQEKIDQFRKTMQESLSQIFYLALPATAFFLVLRVQIVRFAYGAKTFPWLATIVTGRTLAAIAFSILFQSGIQLIVRGFYAFRDTKTPFLISMVCVLINILTSVFMVFVLDWGIYGLALAFTISNCINFLLLFFIFNFKKEKFINKNTLSSWIKMAFSSVAAAFICWGTMRFLDIYIFLTTKTFALLAVSLISGGFGLGVYFLLSKLFKLEELRIMSKLWQKIGAWRNILFNVQEIIEPSTEDVGGTQ